MGYLLAFTFIIFLALVGKSLVGFSLILPLILAISFKTPSLQSFFLAFFSGLVASFMGGSILGRESLGLLLASGLVYLYGRRFSSRHFLFTLVFAGLGSLVYSVVVGRHIRLIGVGIDAVLVALTLPIVVWWREKFFQESIVIKV